jgi:hypothetical protein
VPQSVKKCLQFNRRLKEVEDEHNLSAGSATIEKPIEGPAISHFDQSAYYIHFPLEDEEKGRLILQCTLLAGILVLGVVGALLFFTRKKLP